MSIQNEIDRINSNITSAYEAVREKGGTIPEQANSNNLPAAIAAIPLTGGVGGHVSWEDIDGRPDLSKVSVVTILKITLSKDLWDDENQLVATVPGVSADFYKQDISVVPDKESRQSYIDAGITCEDQGENSLTFHAKKIPEVDIVMAISINESVETREIPAGEFDWWSPHMTSDTEPAPYVASASSCENDYYARSAFDANANTSWRSSNGVNGQWIEFDFGKKTYISGIRISSISSATIRGRLPRSFSIKGSNDGNDWKLIHQADGSEYESATSSFHEYLFTAVHYRYYRLICETVYSGTAVLIVEFEFLKQKEVE